MHIKEVEFLDVFEVFTIFLNKKVKNNSKCCIHSINITENNIFGIQGH